MGPWQHSVGSGEGMGPPPRSASGEGVRLVDALRMGPLGRGRIVGSTIGPWLVEAELGRGGMGVVVRARPRAGGEPVALKVLSAGLEATDVQLRRFEREARLPEGFDHPGVVRVLDVGEDAGCPWLAMELVDGEPLTAVFERQPPPSVAEVVRLVHDTADAMAALHARDVIHRDLKPDNVLVQRRDGRPRVTDFGLARDLATRSSLTKSGGVLGTPAFMAPEQVQGKGLTAAADVFALGVILYRGLAGEAPFPAANLPMRLARILAGPPEPPSARRPGVSKALDAVCLRALAAKPEARYPDAGAFRDALAAAGGLGGAPPAASPGPRGGPAALAAGLAGLCLGAVLGGAAGWVARGALAPPAGVAPAAAPAPGAAPDAPSAAPAGGPVQGPSAAPVVDPEEGWRRVLGSGASDADRVPALRAFLRDHPEHAAARALWERVRPWERRSLGGGPAARDGCEACFDWDPASGRLVLFGGWDGKRRFRDAWALGADGWAALPDGPPGRFAHAGAWDAARGRLVVFGGVSERGPMLAETWELAGDAWTERKLLGGPEARAWHRMVWDPDGRRILCFAGRVVSGTGPMQDDLWSWDGEAWHHLPATERPPARHAAVVVWDAAHHRIVVWGGFGERGVLGDLWVWSGGWSAPRQRGEGEDGVPQARSAAGAASDGRRVVLFGGQGRSTLLDDTWALEGSTWRRLAPAVSPGPRSWHAMAWDPGRRRFVLFGGGTPAGRTDEVWEYPEDP